MQRPFKVASDHVQRPFKVASDHVQRPFKVASDHVQRPFKVESDHVQRPFKVAPDRGTTVKRGHTKWKHGCVADSAHHEIHGEIASVKPLLHVRR